MSRFAIVLLPYVTPAVTNLAVIDLRDSKRIGSFILPDVRY